MAQAKSQRAISVVPVSAVYPIRGSISEITRTTTRIEAENRIEVTTEVMGRCTSVKFDEGDEVTKGQVLVELDKTEQLAQLRQQQAQEMQAQRDFDRMKKLYAAGIKSEEEYDAVWSSLQQQQETVNQTREQLAKYTIRSPLTGLVSMKDVQLGEICSSGTPIFTVIDPSSFMLTVRIEESERPRLHPGQRALVTVDALGDAELETVVRRVNPTIDPNSGTVSLILDFAKEDVPRLHESAFARVRLIMDTHENALLVPKDAIVEENSRSFVFVVRELPAEDSPAGSDEPLFKATRIEVSTGLENSDYIEVLDGLSDGDQVVTYGQQTLKSESRVRVTSVKKELEIAAAVSAEEALEIARTRKARGTKDRNVYMRDRSL